MGFKGLRFTKIFSYFEHPYPTDLEFVGCASLGMLRGYSGVGRSRESLRMLQGVSGDALGILWGLILWGWARSRPGGEEFALKSNNPTPRVGN